MPKPAGHWFAAVAVKVGSLAIRANVVQRNGSAFDTEACLPGIVSDADMQMGARETQQFAQLWGEPQFVTALERDMQFRCWRITDLSTASRGIAALDISFEFPSVARVRDRCMPIVRIKRDATLRV